MNTSASAQRIQESHELDARVGGTVEEAQRAPSPAKVAADQKAGDAAVRRMVRGPGDGGPDGGVNPAPEVAAGESGMLTKDLQTTLDGNAVTLPAGTVVEVVGAAGDSLTCKVWSSFGGKQATVPKDQFQSEPGLTHKEDPGHTSEQDDYSYKSYKGALWNGDPKASDVAQGYIGDCYLISAMGAVAAANPQAIKSLFSPQTPGQSSYTISLYVRDASYSLVKKSVTVDTNLPSNGAPVYAQLGKNLGDGQTPMWPALLEKAYAQLNAGGYQKIGGGGSPADAMETFTGVESTPAAIAGNEDAVLAQFREFQKNGQAVVCATLDSKQATSKSGFVGAGDGPYNMKLTGDDGSQVELVPSSLSIYDTKNKAPRVTDDGNGNLVGDGVQGTVGYGWGAAPTVTYGQGTGPGAAGDLQADYQWRGQLDKNIDVYANHAYMFESVTPDGKLQFKNPWGVENPQPMSAADFKRLFIGIDTNPVPKDQTGPTTKN